MIKMSQKILLLLQVQFLLATSRTTVKKKLNGAYFSQKINAAYLQSLVSTVNFLREILDL